MLTFETRGGSELDELRVPAGTTVDLSDYSSERAGYDFALWYPDESFSGSIDEIYMDRDKTVYAAWEPFADAAPGDCSMATSCTSTKTASWTVSPKRSSRRTAL